MADFRVIVVNDTAAIPGGADKCAVLSAAGLARRGVATTLFAGTGALPEEFAGEPGLAQTVVRGIGSEIEPATWRRTVRNAWNDGAYDAMRAEIARGEAAGFPPERQIVHLHTWAVTLSPSVVVAAQDAGARVAVSLHDYHAVCPQGQFFDVRAGSICHRKPGGPACVTRHCMASKTWVGKAAHLYRWRVQRGRGGLPTRVRHFGMFSPKSIEILRPFLPEDARIHPMHLPILADPGPRVPAERNRRFVHSGRLSREKNPGLLIEAARRIGAEVRFIGDGPLRGELEAMGYAGASFSGWVGAAELARELEGARALALTSVWYEVNPIAPVEALGRGIPVLASDDTTTTGEIVEGETGFAFRSKDAADLAERMGRLLDDGVCERMSRAAYDRFWASPPTPEHHVDLLLAMYDEMLSEPAPSGDRG